eukprot:5528980-Pyramimonas_sp.AAC.1
MCELWVGWANFLRHLSVRFDNRSVAAVLLSKDLGEPSLDKKIKTRFSSFLGLAPDSASCVPRSAVRGKSSTRALAVTWLTVYRQFRIDPPDPGGQCVSFGSVGRTF